MGLIGNMLVGAGLGGVEGEGEEQGKKQTAAALAYSADNHERMKQELESKRTERDIGLKGELERPLREAQTKEAIARAAWLDRDKAKESKTMKLIPVKDENGNVIALQDENSDLRAVPTPGHPAKEGSAPWYTFGLGAKEGAQPAVPPGMDWYDGAGQRVAGPHVRYPDMVRRGAGGEETAPAAPTQPAGRPPMSALFGVGSAQAAPAKATAPAAAPAATQPPAAAPASPQATPQSAPTDASGSAFDSARSKLSTAKTALQSFGLVQRRRDPHGYAMAQQAVDEAQRELQASKAQYEKDLGPIGGATAAAVRPLRP